MREENSQEYLMNLTQMETALKRYGFDSSDPLPLWLNSAMRDIETNADWPFLVNSVTSSQTGKNKLIAIPERTTKIITVRDVLNEKKLQYWDIRKFNREIQNTAAEGLPQIYTLINGSAFINVFPIPTVNYTIETVVIQESEELVAPTDEPKIAEGKLWPKAFHFPVVLKAAIIALDAENEEERASKQMERYEKMMEDLRRRYIEATADEPQTVQDVQGYGGSSFGRIGGVLYG